MAGDVRYRVTGTAGSSGFEEFLEAMAEPRHQQHREFVRWCDRRFDPTTSALILSTTASPNSFDVELLAKPDSPKRKPVALIKIA